jgi:FixJ family two-component response regulator
MKTNKIYIVDDDILVARALQWLLKSVNLNTEIFLDPRVFISNYPQLSFGCVLLDVRMPHHSGMELLKTLRKDYKTLLPIIMITAHGDIPMAVEAIKNGAIDFISKPFNDQILLEKIQRAISKTPECSFNSKEFAESAKLYMSLTVRERQILNLIVDGLLNKQISAELKIAISTVEMHRSHIMQKMQAKNLSQLIKKTVTLNI